MNDERLLELLNADPDKGMSKLIETYSGIVWSVVRSRLRPPVFSEEDVEDCVGDAFAELWRDRAKLDLSRGSLKSWLAKLALNNACDRLRRRMGRETTVPIEELPESQAAVEVDFTSGLRRAELIAALDKLKKPDREAVVRKYFLGQSSKSIAECMGSTVSAVDTRTHRAVKKLREIMGGNENEG